MVWPQALQDLELHLEAVRQNDLGGREGLTGYIDFLEVSDFRDDEKVFAGTDCFNRKFIAIRYYYKNSPRVWVLFQRYSDDKEIWTVGGQAPPRFHHVTAMVLSATVTSQVHVECLDIFRGAVLGANETLYTAQYVKNNVWETRVESVQYQN